MRQPFVPVPLSSSGGSLGASACRGGTLPQLGAVQSPKGSSAAFSKKQRGHSEAGHGHALRAVKQHLSAMDDYMQRRAPTRLEEALRGVQGKDYLKTLSAVRRSGSTPARDRNQIETAMATRVVKARVKLGEWQQGVQEIASARKSRDVGKLRDALQAWSFAEDEPLVVSARKDLDRWQHLEKTLQPRLREAMIRRDVQKLAELLEEVGPSAPPSVVGLPEARNLLHRHETQSRALREALMSNRSERISTALQAWEFAPTDQLAKQATATLSLREEKLRRLQEANAPSDGSAPDGQSLQEASAAWNFEDDEEEFLRAQNLSASYLHAKAELSRLSGQVPLDLPALRGALVAWSFRRENNPEVKEAEGKLAAHQRRLEDALAAKDAWGLRTVWRAGGSSAAGLDGSDDLGARVLSMLEKHSERCEELWVCFQKAIDLNVEFRARISQLVAEWPFAQDDPVLDFGRSWLRLHDKATSRSLEDMAAAVSSGLPRCAMAALQRRQGVSESSQEVTAARSLCRARRRACQLAASAAHGVAIPRCCSAAAAEEEEEEDDDDARRLLLNCQEQGVGLAAASRALEAVERMTKKDFVEIGNFVMPPLGLKEICQVVRILVAGTDNQTPVMTASEHANDGQAHKILCLEKTAYLRAFEFLPCLVAAGCRKSVLAAREAFDRYKNSPDLADVWNREAMQRRAPLAVHLYDFILHVFEMDKLIQEKRLLLAGQSSWPSCPVTPPDADSVLEGLKEGMAGSSVLASFWVMHGGDANALHEIAARARAHAEATQARFQAADQALSDLKGDPGILGTAAEPISQQIDDCIAQMKALPAATLEVPCCPEVASAAGYVAWGPSLWPPSAEKFFGVDCEKDLQHPSLQEGMLLALENARKSIASIAAGGGGGGEEESSPAGGEEDGDEVKMSASLQLACLVGARWALKTAPANDHVVEVLRSSLEVQSRVLLEIAPAAAIRHGARRANAEAKRSAKIAEEAAAASSAMDAALTRPASPPAPGEPGPAEMEAALALGLAAPHVQHVAALSAERVQQLFSMLKQMAQSTSAGSAQSSPAGSWLRWMAAALAERQAPLTFFQAALRRLAESLDSALLAVQAQLQCKASVAKFRLLGAAALLLQPKPMDLDGVQEYLQDRHRFWQALSAWSPAEDGAVDNFNHAGATLLDLWGWFESGCDDDLGLQRLYAWATLAVSLSSQLPHVQVLAPASKITQEAALRLSTAQEEHGDALAQEREELAVWSDVRQSLYQHCPHEPWWWLVRLGCESAEAFYKENNLEPDEISLADILAAEGPPQQLAADDTFDENDDDDDEEGDGFEEEKPSPGALMPEAAAEAAAPPQPAVSKKFSELEFEGDFEGDFEDDKARQVEALAEAPSAAPPQPAVSKNYTEFEGDFEGDFEEDKDKVEALAEAPSAAPPQPAVSKNYTEFEGDFEGDFEEDKDKVPEMEVVAEAPSAAPPQPAVSKNYTDGDFEEDEAEALAGAPRPVGKNGEAEVQGDFEEDTPSQVGAVECAAPAARPEPMINEDSTDFDDGDFEDDDRTKKRAAGASCNTEAATATASTPTPAPAPAPAQQGGDYEHDDDFEEGGTRPASHSSEERLPSKLQATAHSGTGEYKDDFDAASAASHTKNNVGCENVCGDAYEFEGGDKDFGEFEADGPATGEKDEDDEFEALLDRCGTLEGDHQREDGGEEAVTVSDIAQHARTPTDGASLGQIGSLEAAGAGRGRGSASSMRRVGGYEEDEDEFEDELVSRASSRRAQGGSEDHGLAAEEVTAAPRALLLDWGGLSQAASPSPTGSNDSEPQGERRSAGQGKIGGHAGDDAEEFEGDDDFEGDDLGTPGNDEDGKNQAAGESPNKAAMPAATAPGDDYDFED